MNLSLPLLTVPPIIPSFHLYSGCPAKMEVSYESSYSGIKCSPAKTRIMITVNWKIACPRICLNIVVEIIYSSREWGGLLKSSYDGGSVARANEPSVSMIKFTHSMCIGLNIYCFSKAAPINVIDTATTFTVSWNWMNLRMQS